MYKKLKSTVKPVENLKRKSLIYLNNNINLKAEMNHEFIVSVLENIDLIIDVKQYEKFKDDKEELLYQLALLTFNEEQLVSEIEIEFMKNIIMNNIDIENPIIIDDECLFVIKFQSFQEIYKKALI